MLLLTIACTGTPQDTQVPAQEAAPDTGLELSAPEWTAEDAEASWTAEDVRLALEQNAQLGFPQPESIRSTFLTLVQEQGDESCPPNGVNFPTCNCTAESGHSFKGISIYEEVTESSGDELTFSHWAHVAEYLIVRPDGSRYEAGGSMLQQANISADRAEVSWKVRGSWWDQGAPWFWFSDRLSWLATAEGLRNPQGVSLTLDGGISTGRSLDFDEVVFQSDTSCPLEGQISIQGDDGYWYRWQAGCDGCGPVAFQDGQELGVICPVLDSWVNSATQLVPALSPEEDSGL